MRRCGSLEPRHPSRIAGGPLREPLPDLTLVVGAAGQQLGGFQEVRIQPAAFQERKRLLEEQRQGSGQGFLRGLVFRHIQPQAAQIRHQIALRGPLPFWIRPEEDTRGRLIPGGECLRGRPQGGGEKLSYGFSHQKK